MIQILNLTCIVVVNPLPENIAVQNMGFKPNKQTIQIKYLTNEKVLWVCEY